MPAVQPTKTSLNTCSVNGINYYNINSAGEAIPAFHVKELRVYEDHCKHYFTGQLVIETEQNFHEFLLGPTVPVILNFDAPRTDGGSTRVYNKRFRIYSYESKPLSGGTDGRMEHTIQLISQEFYNDRHNTVQQGFSMIPGTAAAAAIHGQYLQVEGGLQIPVPSIGPIANKDVPHQSRNVKPVKAIHDILDRCVFPYRSCAPVYFKDVDGYVIAPLQYLLENAAIKGKFVHKMGAAEDFKEALEGYENVIHFRPMAAPGEGAADASSMVTGILNAAQFFDVKSGSTQNVPSGGLSGLGGRNSAFLNKIPNVKARVQEMLGEAMRGSFGARNMFHIVDDLMQNLAIQKNGPGGYNAAQEAFLTALTYCQKFWVSVPMQSGLNVTCGSRIKVVHPIVEYPNYRYVEKTLYIPRLIHEIKLTQGEKRQPVLVHGTTDMFGVLW